MGIFYSVYGQVYDFLLELGFIEDESDEFLSLDDYHDKKEMQEERRKLKQLAVDILTKKNHADASEYQSMTIRELFKELKEAFPESEEDVFDEDEGGGDEGGGLDEDEKEGWADLQEYYSKD